jgi:hypothetical protein
MKNKIGEVYHPEDEERDKTLATARLIANLFDVHKTPFQQGINALILSITAALLNADMSIEQKVKLANGVSTTILTNILPTAPEGRAN